MAYVRRSNKTLAETVEALQTAAAEANWTVLAVHDMKQRFVNKGVEVSVLRPSYVSSLFPTTFFGEGPAESEADIIAIVDDSVS